MTTQRAGQCVRPIDPRIAEVAAAERATGLRIIRQYADEVRRDLGLPSRADDSRRALQQLGRSLARVGPAFMGGMAGLSAGMRAMVEEERLAVKMRALGWTPPPRTIPAVRTAPTERAPIYDSVVRDLERAS